MTTHSLTATTPAPGSRRTQGERSQAMRKRLLAATLQCLAEDGYNGATLSSIVRRAGVSRGAQVHHYPNKQALMLDAADDLFRRTYRTLGELMLSIAEESNRLQALVDALWEQVFAAPFYRAYMELLIASQRDTAMRQALEALLARQIAVFEIAIDHYFESVPGAEQDIRPLFIQLYLMLTGLASHAHLLPGSKTVQTYLRRWVKQTSVHMRARKGVRSPPPRPENWAVQHQ
ncbi:MAG: TetR/AcrR family transcriptional regulator [Burkholderiales bacterium]